MSRGYKRRRSIFRADAGRAFLRFLIGMVLLVALCALFYIFVLQGKINIEFAPKTPTQEPVQTVAAEPTPQPSVEATAAPTASPTSAPTAEPTAVPTIEPTAEATAAPTPEPTNTPIPSEEVADSMESVPENLPENTSDNLKLGLKELKVVDNAGKSVIVVRGYAYIEGADAAQSQGYILLTDAASGEMLGRYPVTPRPEDADLAFEATSGSNLDQAFFQLNVDVSSLYDGIYLISMAVENNGTSAWNYFDDSMFHFYVMQGVAVLSE
ncbi:MAG: PT domain-containing protein [Clostridia bacterium]|nr:PT domain-containing protein [Clostridia bacterium]MBR4443887.1 PT domain-containing protein [Clostridia bacterium]